MKHICLLLLLFLASCAHHENEATLSTITLVDRNGFTETISNHDRLSKYSQANFLCNQPYKKVVRVYKRDACGNVYSSAISYHENGEPHQYLEITNGRAAGQYMQWHTNGTLALQVQILEGEPDLTDEAMTTWIFENQALVWNDEGTLIATIPYCKGAIEGTSIYYHDCGSLWKTVPFSKGMLNGEEKIYFTSGELLASLSYSQGLQDGCSMRYWKNGTLASDELYKAGRLITGIYLDCSGCEVSSVHNGTGRRALFGKESLSELHEYQNGYPEGEILIYDEANCLLERYHVKNGLKHGEDTEYYPLSSKPKLSTTWVEGQVVGHVKTWYENGNLESEREIQGTQKTGLLTAWYADGSLMMIEEYEKDRLQKGEYYKKGERNPVSKVQKGAGIATLFDEQGNFKTKAFYKNGRPVP